VSGEDALLAGVIDQIPLGVWVARAPGGELLFANQTFREIMGIEARLDVGVGGYSAPYGICGRDGAPYPEARMPFVQALQARTTVTVDDIVVHRHDGRRVNIRATARPMFEGDTVTHVVIVFADITAELAAEVARLAANERGRTRERLEAIGTLAAGVAHDFNNLLAQIRVLAGLLRLRESDSRRVEDLQRIEAATDSAAQLTRSLLAFGRHPTGRATQVDIDELVTAVVDLLRRTFDPRIRIELALAGGALVDGDRNQLEQVVMNLAVNARDAMPDGGRLRLAVSVVDGAALETLAAGRHVVIEVSDSGPGVPAELRARVFEPYFSTKHGRDQPGTGLGLSTAYGVVHAHGGVIEVGDAGPGARFTVHLPAAAAVTTAAPASDAANAGLVAGQGLVLVVDDEAILRRAVRRVIEHLGYRVIEAENGAAAVDAFRAHHGELVAVLLDHLMPVLNGRDTFLKLQGLDAAVPVILTSGQLDEHSERELRRLGIAGLIPKPFDVGELSQALQVAAVTREARRGS